MKNALETITEIAIEIAKTGNFARFSEMDRLAVDNEIFVCECEDGIAIEDDFYRYEF